MNSKLIRGVQYAAWAYFFLYLDINLNRFSLLPNAVGWYLLSRAVTALEEEHPDLRLLGPLTFPLGLWARTVVTVLSTAASVLFYLGVDSSGPLSSFSIALTLFLLAVLVVQILCTTVLLFRFSSALRRAGPVLPEGPGI